MKPTPQISSKQRTSDSEARKAVNSQSFPSTDYNFQATAEACRSVSTTSREDLRTFRRLSSEFLAGETAREYATEFMLFAVVTVISAWPIISAMIAVTRLVRNY